MMAFQEQTFRLMLDLSSTVITLLHHRAQTGAYGFGITYGDLVAKILANHDHMQAYSLMDISLDTCPYAGTTMRISLHGSAMCHVPWLVRSTCIMSVSVF